MIRAALLLLFIAGCSTGVEGETYMGRPGSPAWFATAGSATIHNYFNERCTGYGFVAGTSDYSRCMQMETMSARQTASARSASTSAGMAQASAILLSQNQPAPVIIPQRQVTCFSSRNAFGQVITTCR